MQPDGNPITPAGMAALRARYDHLLGTERPAIVEIVSWAAGNGDRSENGDYLYGRKRMREIDRELNFLARRMKAARVIDPARQPDQTRVLFGATVEIADEDDNRMILTLVGDDEQDATARRIEGFRDVLTAAGQPPAPEQIIACGYPPKRAMQEIAALCDRLGDLPAGLFVNSLTAFEGVLGHFVHLPPGSFDRTVIGCYDYDPFAAYLQFPVHMVRQDSHRLIEEAYALLDSDAAGVTVREVEPELIPPRTIYAGPFGEHG